MKRINALALASLLTIFIGGVLRADTTATTHPVIELPSPRGTCLTVEDCTTRQSRQTMIQAIKGLEDPLHKEQEFRRAGMDWTCWNQVMILTVGNVWIARALCYYTA